jgi:hypothetical protein
MKSRIRLAISIAAAALLTLAAYQSFSQANGFSISVNSLTTNFNYGHANSELKSYKKNFKGFQAGISYQARVSDAFSVVPELYFASKGGVLKEANPITVSKSTLRLSSVEMPVMARIHFNRLYFNAGPYTGYTFNGRIKSKAIGALPSKSARVSFGRNSEEFRRWDLGLLAGGGYQFSTRNSNLTLDARYGYGFISLSRNLERYNRVLNISLYISGVKKKKQAE